jgi:hypothetical protein
MKFLRLMRAMLREIFEEAAYERFCVREGLAVNRSSYARFLLDTDRLNRTRVKCC